MASLTHNANDMQNLTATPAEPDRREVHAWARRKVEQTLLNALLGIATEYLTLAAWQARCVEREVG